jgi:hypothetical protein
VEARPAGGANGLSVLPTAAVEAAAVELQFSTTRANYSRAGTAMVRPMRAGGNHCFTAVLERLGRFARDGGSANMSDDFPDKPKGMHWRAYMRLRHCHDIAALRCTMGLTQFLGWPRRAP